MMDYEAVIDGVGSATTQWFFMVFALLVLWKFFVKIIKSVLI
jgi:cbb3-type cytochrome oxidase subunit 3